MVEFPMAGCFFFQKMTSRRKKKKKKLQESSHMGNLRIFPDKYHQKVGELKISFGEIHKRRVIQELPELLSLPPAACLVFQPDFLEVSSA